jgi:sarcosine oxidase subunit delta
VSLLVPCPFCGERPYTEFAFGGELRATTSPDAEADFARLYLRENVAGVQEERWFHAFGCRRWLTVRRDTTTNAIEA